MFLSSDLTYLGPSRLACSHALANHPFLQETEGGVELNTSWQKQLTMASSASPSPLKKWFPDPFWRVFCLFCSSLMLVVQRQLSLISHQRFSFLSFQLMDSCCQQSCKVSYLTFYVFIIIQILRITYFLCLWWSVLMMTSSKCFQRI